MPLCDLELSAKFHNPRTARSGRKGTLQEERENNAINSGHYVLTG